MRINYVLIDLENIQLTSLSGLDNEQFRVLVFVGANQSKLSFELVCEMQKLGTKAEYIKIVGNGNNALDFHIAYYVGKLSAEDHTAYFHIISKDTGFDPLIQYLKTQHIGIARSNMIGEIPLIKLINAKTSEEKIEIIITNIKQRGSSAPRNIKTLSSTISSIFNKELTQGEIEILLDKLQANGAIFIKDNKISYTFL